MWWSAIVAFALSGLGAMARHAPVKMLLIVFSLPFFWICHRLWQEKKQAADDADAHQLGRLIGAAYAKAPPDGFLDRFADNPWQHWPEVAGDIEVGRVLLGTGEPPGFYLVDVSVNKKHRDEDLASYTVTFVIIPLPVARAGRLQESMIPKSCKAVEGAAFLYFYRARTWPESGEGGHMPADQIPLALARATKLAGALA